MKKTDDRKVVRIQDVSHEGHGVGRADGLALFIEDALPGDVMEVSITRKKKTYGFAQKILLLEPSQDRIEAACPHAGVCGGCTYQYYNYQAQGHLKQRQVAEKIGRIGGVTSPLVRPIIIMEQPTAYRNKGILQIDPLLQTIGYHEKKTHQVVDVDHCMLQAPPVDLVAEVLRPYLRHFGKNLQQVVVKTAFHTGEVMVVFIGMEMSPAIMEELIIELDERIALLTYSPNSVSPVGGKYSLESVCHKIPGKNQINVLAGKGTILDTMMGMQFEVSPNSFYQTNPLQTERLYQKAMEYADFSGDEEVLDLYCGVGTIGLFAAQKATKVLGVEIEKDAVLDANRNAILNGMVNISFLAGKAEEEWEKGLPVDPQVVFLDPPRAGCHPDVIKTLITHQPKKIVYISCDPATLARDIKALGEGSYHLEEATPVDMFPWTAHVETVVLMSRVDK
ncbi:MAG: 23S rRNA (uracil(1939)-C(5))-methyltransferase RlmD [Anaerovoracaceae bacterium]